MLFDTITYVTDADWNYDIAGSTLSTPADGDIITRFVATRDFTLPANLAGTQLKVGVNPTTSATVTIKKNGTGVATITINSSGVESLPTQAAVSFVTDDTLEIEVTTADGVDDLGITIKTLAP